MIFDLNYQVRFIADTELGPYADALWMKPTEYDALEKEALEQMAQARADQWVFDLKNPVTREMTKGEMQEKIIGLDQHIAELVAEKERLAAEIAKPLAKTAVK